MPFAPVTTIGHFCPQAIQQYSAGENLPTHASDAVSDQSTQVSPSLASVRQYALQLRPLGPSNQVTAVQPDNKKRMVEIVNAFVPIPRKGCEHNVLKCFDENVNMFFPPNPIPRSLPHKTVSQHGHPTNLCACSHLPLRSHPISIARANMLNIAA